jgi:ComF family protein
LTVLQPVFDLLFPPFCPSCEAPLGDDRQDPLCGPCWRGIFPINPPWCPGCGLPYPDGAEAFLCERCHRTPPPYTFARAAARYREPLRTAIHALKYRGKTALARPLGQFMAEAGERSLNLAEIDGLIPVPLHPARLAERGFNQSALLARELGRRWGVPVLPRLLVRVVPTRPQSDLTEAERRRNVRDAFSLRRPAGVAGGRFLLIDDILTTGATAAECARTLKAGGAASIGVLTLARVE